MNVVYINCSSAPYIDDIENSLKLFESRTKRTLDAVVGQRVQLAESGRRDGSIIRCSACFGAPFPVRSVADWDRLRPLHRVPVGDKYDWNDKTRVKWLYPVRSVVPCSPFPVPEGVPHGRARLEY